MSAALTVLLAAASLFAAGDSRIWTGAYTAAQAERGKQNFEKSCSNCHNADLNGSVRAPALRGERFLKNWENGSVHVLFVKLRDSMPATYPDTVPETVKIDILAYLLQVNGFPAGNSELKLDDKELGDILIVPKGAQAAPNFAVVALVGCLARGSQNNWTLLRASEPTVTRDDVSSPAALKDAAAQPLGDGSFELVSTGAFRPESHQGRKVEARGLLYRDSGHNLLNLTSLEEVGGNCGN